MKNAENTIIKTKEYQINKSINSLDNLNPTRILKADISGFTAIIYPF